jgi:magnesium chelatase subunit I
MTVESVSPLAKILPYSLIVGQKQLKLALELAYIAPRIGGVLLSGQRGTGKSTAVRAFTQMMYAGLPVTLPINATEDRVVGGWQIDKLMQSQLEPQPGLLTDADGSLLYIDEVNLLDDHIVNIILDVTSTGILEVQRDGQNKQLSVSFTLVGTMNPEEGGLRPQLLDRFGLMVSVTAEANEDERVKILQTVLEFDEAVTEFNKLEKDKKRKDVPETEKKLPPYINDALEEDKKRKNVLEKAREKFSSVTVPENIARNCVKLAAAVKAEGNRGDYTIALAARAYAALEDVEEVTNEHVATVVQMALQHRHPEGLQNSQMLWNEKYQQIVRDILDLEGD